MSGPRVLALSVFHAAMAAAALIAAFRAVVFFEDQPDAGVVAVVTVCLLAVVCWATRRALSKPARPAFEAFFTRGLRWGAIAGVVFWFGLTAIWVAAGAIAITFFEPEGARYNMMGGRYAFVVLPLIVLLPGMLIALGVGASIGGVIGIVDRTLVAITQSRSGPRQPR